MRRRILGSMLAVTAVALVLLGVPLAVAIGRLYHSQEIARLQREANLAAGAVPTTGLGGPDLVEPPASANRRIAFGYYSPAGRLVAGNGPATADVQTQAALQAHASEATNRSHLVVAVPISAGEVTSGAVRASAPLGPLHARTYRTWAAMALLGGAALGVAAAIGHRQARKLATPVTDLAAAMRRLGEGDFTVRVATGTGNPEVDVAGDALNLTAEDLGRLLEQERSFSADASHQLRTPLAALRVTLESALVTSDQSAEESLSGAIAELDRLQATVEELLAHARNAARPRDIVDFDAIIAAAQRRWHGQLAARGRPLRAIAGPVPAVRASTTAITQILDVLLDNAVVHGRGPVTVRIRRAGPGVALDVADEGPGIDQDVETIFGRGVSRSDGNGIGLALARSLAHAEGGELVVRQAAPSPTFSLVLPAERQPARPASVPRSPAGATNVG